MAQNDSPSPHLRNDPSPSRSQALSVSIHPDDAKDKVFTAILKALLKMGNKPSSPKELANVIVKYKYATLGGATPFATVSSRISQHFKRAAEHNPPRPPLLAKHIDQNHSRKINYSLATNPPSHLPTDDTDSVLSSEEEDEEETHSLKRHLTPEREDEESHLVKRIRREPSLPPPTPHEESDSEHSDYHEEMLKGDETMADVEISQRRRSSVARRRQSIFQPGDPSRKPSVSWLSEHDVWAPYEFEDFDSVFLDEANHHHYNTSFNIAAPESISASELDTYFANGPNSVSRASRKSFSAIMERERSLLQHALLASTVAHVAAEPKIVAHPRRNSWPSDSVSSADLDIVHEQRQKKEQKTPLPLNLPLRDQKSTSPTAEQPVATATADPIEHESNPSSSPNQVTYSDSGHRFTITKKTCGNLQCYELHSPEDIPDTNILRFIASLDGASEHVALRTRHADNSKGRRNSQYFYLDEGYVNATQLRKAARPVLGKGSFDAVAESENGGVIVSITKGPLECRGTWVPLSRARELVEEFEIESSPGLTKLLSEDPMDELPQDRRASEQETTGVPIALSPAIEPLLAAGTKSEEGDVFVKFEEDEKKPPAQPDTAAKMSMATNTPSSATEILRSMNIQNLNLSALHHMTAAIPSLAHLSPTFDLARSLAVYMQAVAKDSPTATAAAAAAANNSNNNGSNNNSNNHNKPSTSTDSTSSAPATPSYAFDLKTALSRFPALDALLKKETPAPPAAQDDDNTMVRTTTPTTPPMYITVIDNVAVCVAVLPGATGTEHRIMRRLDSGYINGTSLLTAGDIETESERSMILSFEMERVRVPTKDSPLYGTWIPLRRAQELAVTCSIQNRLGPFLSDSIEGYFPSPLPIEMPQQKPRDNHLTRMALAALREATPKSLGYMTPAITRKPPNRTPAAHLHQLMLTKLKSHHKPKAPLLGSFDDSKDGQRVVRVVDGKRKQKVPTTATTAEVVVDEDIEEQEEQEQKVEEIMETNTTTAEDSEADTDSDTDVEEVRKKMKRMREAAIEAISSGRSSDLEELLSRASNPIVHHPKRTIHIRPPRDARRRRLTDEDSNSGSSTLTTSYNYDGDERRYGRRRPMAHGGKWSAGGGKLMPSLMKKSASWSGALSSPRAPLKRPRKSRKKQSQLLLLDDIKEDEEEAEIVANRVVEHNNNTNKNNNSNSNPQKSTTTTSSSSSTASSSPSASEKPVVSKTTATAAVVTAPAVPEEEEDDDEEIDIGGSEEDDDLR
ncbi:hypothetical protein DFQ28_004369 [Apophysomyces sp. BC1034]|nr:hypothetical protein DFQ30_004212 [Apophysomyces sp. BC1015]KAG0178557.1 hypothetical protein DFQ29_003307 [Apophysomyces sp. BC1021]KAG0188787.1 hypothetical protein DFQ28_004369 [Apophysomyces sp. BC1034]